MLAKDLLNIAEKAKLAKQQEAQKLKEAEELRLAEEENNAKQLGIKNAEERYPNILEEIKQNAENGIFKTNIRWLGTYSCSSNEAGGWSSDYSVESTALCNKLSELLVADGFQVHVDREQTSHSWSGETETSHYSRCLVVKLPAPSDDMSLS